MDNTFAALAKSYDPYITKYNHYHDALGRFTTASGGVAHATVRGGGSTTSMRHGTSPKGGYMVCTNPERGRAVKLPVKAGKAFQRNAAQAAIRKYIKDNKDILFAKGSNKFLGTWVDTETGMLWLDISTNVSSKSEAMKLGQKHGEIAIWDVKGGSEIRLK